MEHLNISIVLCEKCDDDVKNIYNIFDILKIDENNRGSFTIVTFINGYGKKIEKMGLYYFMKKLNNDGNGKFIYLGGVYISQSEEENTKLANGEVKESSQSNPIVETIKNYFENVAFLDKGQYEIQVFKYEDDEVVLDVLGMSKEERRKLRNMDNLVAIYNFEAI